jgi:ACT domain-containing protein
MRLYIKQKILEEIKYKFINKLCNSCRSERSPKLKWRITKELAAKECNILDISQTLSQGIFAMILVIQLPETLDLLSLRDQLKAAGEKLGVKVVLQHADIFQFMHRI